jgi:hypothetical protein
MTGLTDERANEQAADRTTGRMAGVTAAARAGRMSKASPGRTARIAGLLYLLVTAAGPFALWVRSITIVRGDAALTAASILASESLYRLGVAAELLAALCYVGVTLLLYDVFRPVSRSVSFRAALLGYAGCVTGAVMCLNLLAPLVILRPAPYLSVFSAEQRQAVAFLFTRLFAQGSTISFLFFGCYCLTLGYLVLRSTFLPRVLGALLMAAGIGWLTNSLATLLGVPLALSTVALAVGAIGEGAFTLWLVARGVDVARWNAQAKAARESELADLGRLPGGRVNRAEGYVSVATP